MPAEQAALRSWAASRPTPKMRRDAGVLLALGLGCGLSAEDINPLRAGHVDVTDRGVDVHIGGRRARTVTCLAAWEALLSDAVAAVGADELLFRSRRPSARPGSNYYSHFVERNANDGPRLNSQRARVTWIVHHLTCGTALNTLIAASGIRNGEALGRYLDFVPAPDPDEARRQLRDQD